MLDIRHFPSVFSDSSVLQVLREARKGHNSDSSLHRLLAAYFVLVLLPLIRTFASNQSPANGFANLYYTNNLVGLTEELFPGECLDILRYI